WVLWNNRNNKVWNDTIEEGRCLGMKAWHLWQEWKSVQQHKHNTPAPVQQQQPLFWQKPMEGWYKCNVDAGFHQDLNKTSAGWVEKRGLYLKQ
ncbi:polynucleotidyl transferase ribonuclease H fold, partial [Trifolium medium]|nr:polynucleotidyl transferase ribonuclease H fold [Trifolium medium]